MPAMDKDEKDLVLWYVGAQSEAQACCPMRGCCPFPCHVIPGTKTKFNTFALETRCSISLCLILLHTMRANSLESIIEQWCHMTPPWCIL